MPALSARDRRVLTRGAAIIAVALFVGRGLPAYRSWLAGTRAAATELATSVARLEGTMAAGARPKDSLAARSARLAAIDSVLLAGDSPAASAAQLASAITTIATASKVRVGAVQLATTPVGADTTRRVGPYAVVTVRVDLVGDIQGLLRVLAALEQEAPRWERDLAEYDVAVAADSGIASATAELRRQQAYLAGARARIRELSMTQPAPAAPASEPEMLQVELTVEALARLTTRGHGEAGPR